jgi:carbon storage regulator
MLVLTRRIEESLVINDNIIVTVLAVEGDKVKLGIAAPREVTILRMELWQAMQDQGQAPGLRDDQPKPDGERDS